MSLLVDHELAGPGVLDRALAELDALAARAGVLADHHPLDAEVPA